MSATDERERAVRLARTDFRRALELARKVSQPWFRCQALAWVARFAPESEVVRIVQEALRAVSHAEDPYRKVVPAAWPIRALIERGHGRRAAALLPNLIEASGRIGHPVSRIEALLVVIQAAWPLGASTRAGVREALIAACRAASSWRAGRALRDLALMVAAEDEEEAQRLIASMPEGVYRRQAVRRLAEGQRLKPRSFFWE